MIRNRKNQEETESGVNIKDIWRRIVTCYGHAMLSTRGSLCRKEGSGNGSRTRGSLCRKEGDGKYERITM